MSLLKKVNALAKLQQESPLKALQDQVASLTQQVGLLLIRLFVVCVHLINYV